MAKFSRFDPRNKKNGRHKKMTIGEYPKGSKKTAMDVAEDKKPVSYTHLTLPTILLV